MNKKTGLSLVLIAGMNMYAFAQENHNLQKVEVIQESSNNAPVQNEAFSAPESSKLTIDKLTEEEIKIANPGSVLEAVNMTTGANVQFQGRKNSAIITFRGSTNIYSAAAFGVILDGALLAPMSSLRIMESLSIDVIESIEVIRDASALTLGPIAGFGTPNGSPTLGYIVIKTKLPKKNGGTAKLAYESFDTTKADISYGGIHDDIFYLASLSGFFTDGRDGFNTAEERGSVFLRSGYVDEDFSATLSAYYSNADKETQKATDPLSKVTASEWKYEPMENEFVSAIIEKNFNQNNKTTLQLSHTKAKWSQDFDRTNPSEISPSAFYFKGSQSTDSIDLRHALKIDDTLIKAGAQAIFYDAPQGELFYEGYRRKEQIYGAFVHASHSFDDGRLIIDESFRIDRKHIDSSIERYDPNSVLAGNVTKLNNAELSIIKDQWAKSSIALSLGAIYKFNDNLEGSARFAYMTSGAPDGSLSADGSDMKDEESYRYEAGIKKMINNYFIPTLNLFLYDNKNTKSPLYLGTNADPYIVFNQIDQERYGGELGFEGADKQLYYSFSYAYATADEKTNEIPKHTLSAIMRKKIGGYSVNLSAKYVSEYESNFFTKDNRYHKVGDFCFINVSADYNHKLFGNDARLSIYSRNLTDDHYVTIFGFENQGRVIGTSYEFKF